MVEFFHQYPTPVTSPDGTLYVARAYGTQRDDGLWEGRLVFFPMASGDPLPTERETTQSKREDLAYWAAGIEPVYLQGALPRAIDRSRQGMLARRIARADREQALAEAEAAIYRAAAEEAIAIAHAAEQRRIAAEKALEDGS